MKDMLTATGWAGAEGDAVRREATACLVAGDAAPADTGTMAQRDVADPAQATDRSEGTLAADLAALHDSGMLARVVRDCLPGGDALTAARALREIGRASLSVGRSVEDHAAALRLIYLYGSPAQRGHAMHHADHGALFGVWGADGSNGVMPAPDMPAPDGARPGAAVGLVGHAVIPVATVAGPQLYCADVTDLTRVDQSAGQVSRLRGLVAGGDRINGLPAERIGRVNDYLSEPHVEGGFWRSCALQCGGLEALVAAARQHILACVQVCDPQQRALFARLSSLCHSARLWIESACSAVERFGQGASVPQVLLARDAVEQACQSGLALTERIMGSAACDAGSDVDRIRRDLGHFRRRATLVARFDLVLRMAALGEPRLNSVP